MRKTDLSDNIIFEKSWESKIYHSENISRIYTTTCIDISNKKVMEQCLKIINYFINGKECFFELSRTDGINISSEEFVKYKNEIPSYFKKNGEFDNSQEKIYDNTIGRAPINENTYIILPKIFNYYLETVFFIPKISWKEYRNIYQEGPIKGAEFYIKNSIADFIFGYVDSGIFLISFNSQKYDNEAMYKDIMTLIYND